MKAIWDTALSFAAQGGVFDGLISTNYPTTALWADAWRSGLNGAFPTNVILPRGDWSLVIDAARYEGIVLTGAVSELSQSVALQNTRLSAVDTNANGIADAWEALVFGGELSGNGDGVSDRDEYRLGTDPHQKGDVFQSDVSGPLTNRIATCWTGHAGREYEIQCTSRLTSNAWQRVYGPVTANINHVTLRWEVTNSPAMPARFYRVGRPQVP